jgi:hypothetical protein
MQRLINQTGGVFLALWATHTKGFAGAGEMARHLYRMPLYFSDVSNYLFEIFISFLRIDCQKVSYNIIE